MYTPSEHEKKEAFICAEQMNLSYTNLLWRAAVAKGMTPCAIALAEDGTVLQSQWVKGNWIYVPLNIREWMINEMVVYDWVNPHDYV